MTVDPFLFQLAVVFLPGLIWASLDATFVAKPKPSEFEFVVRAFLFGLASYAVVFVFYRFLHWPFVVIDFKSAKGAISSDVANEVLSAVVCSIALALLWTYVATYKLLVRLLHLIRATKRYGNEDVWDFTFSSREAAVEYVNFRDLVNQIVYSGWVKAFSETDKLRELVLRDVEVFDFQGNKLFAVPLLYLARPSDNLHIEFPYSPTPPALPVPAT